MDYKNQPDIRPIQESGDVYILNDDFEFIAFGQRSIIPKGFRHDGATGAGLLFGKDGVHRAAALIHDYLYVNKGFFVDGLFYPVTRKQADVTFKDYLELAGVKSLHIKFAYRAVRVIGYFYWRD